MSNLWSLSIRFISDTKFVEEGLNHLEYFKNSENPVNSVDVTHIPLNTFYILNNFGQNM